MHVQETPWVLIITDILDGIGEVSGTLVVVSLITISCGYCYSFKNANHCFNYWLLK